MSEIITSPSAAEIEAILDKENICLEDIAIARRFAEANNLNPEAMVNAVKYKYLRDKEQFIDAAIIPEHNFQFDYPDGFGDGCINITDAQGNFLESKIILPAYLTQSLLQDLNPGVKLKYEIVLMLYMQHKQDILYASAQDNLNDIHDIFEMLVGHIQQGFNDQQILYLHREYEQLACELLPVSIIYAMLNTQNNKVANDSAKAKMRP